MCRTLIFQPCLTSSLFDVILRILDIKLTVPFQVLSHAVDDMTCVILV